MWRAIRETSRIPILAGSAVAVGASVALEHGYSEVNNVADSYVAVMLASRGLQKDEQQLKPSIQRHLCVVDRRVQWSLEKHKRLHYLFQLEDADWAVYRLEWMAAHLRGLAFQLDRAAQKEEGDAEPKKKVSFDEESRVLYDTKVDESYLDPAQTTSAHSELDSLLPGSKPLHVRHAKFQTRIMIPKKKYESVFRQLVDDILENCAAMIPELQSATVIQQYLDDAKQTCEAWVEPEGTPRKSKMKVNIARAISYDKAQQLAVHELTHHFQLVLMEEYLYNRCPEMRVAPDLGPMGIVLEGGAEAMVELYFNPQAGGVVDRVQDLEQRMPKIMSMIIRADDNNNPKQILDVERITWFGLWPTVIRLARNYQNGTIDKDECIQEMLKQALKRHDSWPNADFFDEVGALTLGYGYGKEMILQHCEQEAAKKEENGGSSSVLNEYIQFMKRPMLS